MSDTPVTILVEIGHQITNHIHMNKSQLISTVKSLSTDQAQIWHDHIFVYIQANKHYPRLRYIWDKLLWTSSIDVDFANTIGTMTKLWYTKLADYRAVARALTQYHTLEIPNIVRISEDSKTRILENSNTVLLHNITAGIDISQWDQRYSRNLDSDLTKLLW